MSAPSRRLHARFPCRIPFTLPKSRKGAAGQLLNIGMGGAFLRAQGELDTRRRFQMQVSLAGRVFLITAEVVWNGGPDPKDPKSAFYGIRFPDDEATRSQVRPLVDLIRSGGTGDSGPRISRDYWNL